MPKCPPGIPRTPPHSTPPPPPPLHPPPPPLPPRPPYSLPHPPSTDPLPRQVRAHYICLARAGKHKVPPTDPLATLFCNGHMPFSVSLPWLREAVRLDRRRAQALPQAPSNVGRPFSYKRRTRPLWKHPPPQPSVLRTKTNRCPPLFFYLLKVAPPPRRARGTRARITQAGSVLPRRVRLVRLALAAQEDFLYSCLGRHESI